MPLGLAKDSMLNLAEMAQQREHDDDVNSEEKVNSDIRLEDGDEDTLVMHLATHEIQALDEIDFAEESKDDSLTAEEEAYGESKVASASDTIGDGDSLRNSAAAQLDAPSTQSSERETSSAKSSTPNGTATSYGNYTGFSSDYSEYEHYGDYSTYGKLDVFNKKDQPFWCCLMPWAKRQEQVEAMDGTSSVLQQGPGQESMVDVQENSHSGQLSRSSSKDDDEVSTGSDVLGERLSDKDRQAVLARLRLAQPDAKGSVSPTSEIPSAGAPVVVKKGLLNEIVNSEVGSTQFRAKGILRRSSMLSGNNLKDSSANSSVDGRARARRSLFPSYETSSKTKKNLHVEFSPMARVLTVVSHKDMDEKEKGEIWWQRSDYEEFRKTGRMITKAMLEGGSEIWLATNQSWQLPNRDKQATLTSAFSLAGQHAKFQKGDVSAKTQYEQTRDKWWHKFGHSRRGLEHIASIDEGRQRQNNVRSALRSVIEEQRRQKLFHREDPEKLRMVCIQHTSWARDLALASGASDADAVQVDFDDESRKSREFYLLKFSRSNQMKVHSTQKASVPAFMKPVLAVPVQGSLLDANTVPQIRYRQTQIRRLASVAPAPTEKSKGKPMPLKLNEDEKPTSSMAKQAAGFASGEQVGNMSHILTGMGATGIPA